MTREQLIEVWKDTESLVKSGKYPYYLRSTRIGNKHDPIEGNCEGNIEVINEDCVEVARKLANRDKTCILNMASYKKPGGGVKSGSMAQEEELARRSNLMFGLKLEDYPIPRNEFIYTPNVTFFKDRQYQVIKRFHCDVITIAAINLNNLNKPKDYDALTSSKILSMLTEPHLKGCKNLVLSAFGCGVFKNDPTYMAECFYEALVNRKMRYLYDNIHFAIINDRNSVSSNFEIFKKIVEK